jgi:hypothetical protein
VEPEPQEAASSSLFELDPEPHKKVSIFEFCSLYAIGNQSEPETTSFLLSWSRSRNIMMQLRNTDYIQREGANVNSMY